MTNQFAGMSEEQFTYEEYEFVRETMVKTVQASITEADKLFILGFKDVIPNWAIYSFEKYPSIKWKLQNLEKIITTNPAKHKELYILLKSKLDSI